MKQLEFKLSALPNKREMLNRQHLIGSISYESTHDDADKTIYRVSSNVSVDVDSAQRSVHEAAETWKSPMQSWTKYQISAQAWEKTGRTPSTGG
jgi:hypothetical protein